MGWELGKLQKEGQRCGKVQEHQEVVGKGEEEGQMHEHKEKADKVLQTEIDKGYVQWAPSRDELEREVGTLHLAKMAVVVKGENTPYSQHEAQWHQFPRYIL